jgi:microcystin-dependent protein
MSEPFLAEIRIVSFDFAPRGWASCDGQILPINQNQALFALLGTTYGGNGYVNFALPDLRGRTPIHFDGAHPQGLAAGEPSHTLIQNEIPAHNHVVTASSNAADQVSPSNNYWADGGVAAYSSATGATLAPAAVSPSGGSQPHENHSPYLALNFVIALQGIFPSRN